MKKVFALACMLLMIGAYSYAQKTFTSENFTTETVDEFGDKTGRYKVGISARGYFSNSAVTDKCANLIISFMEDGSWYSLYEYCGNHPSDEDFKATFIGTTTKETLVTRNGNVPKGFFRLCNENDVINVKLVQMGEYASTTAVFKLYHCKDFLNKYKTKFGSIEDKIAPAKKINYEYIGESLLKIYTEAFFDNGDDFEKSEKPCLVFSKSGTPDVRLDGYFSSKDLLSIRGEIYVDGVIVKRRYNFSTAPQLEDLLIKLKPNALIKIQNTDKQSESISFNLTEEQYSEIMKFLHNELEKAKVEREAKQQAEEKAKAEREASKTTVIKKSEHNMLLYAEPVYPDKNNDNKPSLLFVEKFTSSNGKVIDASVYFKGVFSNWQSLEKYGEIYVDGVKIKTVSFKYSNESSYPVLRDFLAAIKPNSVIKIQNKENSSIAVTFTLTEEQYNEIEKFLPEEMSKAKGKKTAAPADTKPAKKQH